MYPIATMFWDPLQEKFISISTFLRLKLLLSLITLASGKVGLAYTFTVSRLPDELTASGDTISSTATQAGSYPPTVKVRDAEDYAVQKAYTLVIEAAPTINFGLHEFFSDKKSNNIIFFRGIHGIYHALTNIY